MEWKQIYTKALRSVVNLQDCYCSAVLLGVEPKSKDSIERGSLDFYISKE